MLALRKLGVTSATDLLELDVISDLPLQYNHPAGKGDNKEKKKSFLLGAEMIVLAAVQNYVDWRSDVM